MVPWIWMDLRIVFRSSEICCCRVALKICDDHLQLRVERLFKLFKFSLPPIAFTSFVPRLSIFQDRKKKIKSLRGTWNPNPPSPPSWEFNKNIGGRPVQVSIASCLGCSCFSFCRSRTLLDSLALGASKWNLFRLIGWIRHYFMSFLIGCQQRAMRIESVLCMCSIFLFVCVSICRCRQPVSIKGAWESFTCFQKEIVWSCLENSVNIVTRLVLKTRFAISGHWFRWQW